MNATEVRALLQEWFKRELEAASADDPRRGEQCLSLPEIADLARGSGGAGREQEKHLATCGWCSRALAVASRLAEQERSQQVLADSAPKGEWSEELRGRLVAWLETRVESSQERGSAHFDQDGTLHVSCSGVPHEGPVTVSLLWAGTAIRLTTGMARDGALELAVALPELGLRDVTVPSSALLVEPRSVAEEKA